VVVVAEEIHRQTEQTVVLVAAQHFLVVAVVLVIHRLRRPLLTQMLLKGTMVVAVQIRLLHLAVVAVVVLEQQVITEHLP
jgi:hypothetical protein